MAGTSPAMTKKELQWQIIILAYLVIAGLDPAIHADSKQS
jgi:hypothetical protein